MITRNKKISLLTMRVLLLLTFMLAAVSEFTSCEPTRYTIKVAVAANFANTLEEIVDSFKITHSEVDIKIIKGSSGKLTGQILNGAEYDLFLSADSSKPGTLFERGFAKSKPVPYACGALVLFSNSGIYLTSDLSCLNDLQITHIALANPSLAPYGKAAAEAISNSGIVIDTTKFVYGENILQTFQHIDLAAEIGFVSKSLVLQNSVKDKFIEGKNWLCVDPNLYSPINQYMVILNNKEKTVQELFDFILSDSSDKIIQKYGYTR